MSEIMRTRFNEITPVKLVDDITFNEAKSSCITAFKIIGYEPMDFDNVVYNTWITFEGVTLSDFIYEVWRCTHGGE